MFGADYVHISRLWKSWLLHLSLQCYTSHHRKIKRIKMPFFIFLRNLERKEEGSCVTWSQWAVRWVCWCWLSTSANRPHSMPSLLGKYSSLLKDDTLPFIKYLCCIYLCLCLSTVWCERGFSLMNNIKIISRNRMNTDTLDDRMMICSNGCQQRIPEKFMW